MTAARVSEGHDERDARAVGAGPLRTYSRIVDAGWADVGIGREKRKKEK
jgi:hypothetical protein